MKCLTLLICYSLIFLACGSSAEDDFTPNPSDNMNNGCDDVQSTLTGNVIPIINSNCAISGCHVANSQFPDFTVRQNIILYSQGIRTNTQAGIMPPASSGRSLSNEQLTAIYCWVEAGALDN